MCIEEIYFVKYLSFHFYADGGKTFLAEPTHV